VGPEVTAAGTGCRLTALTARLAERSLVQPVRVETPMEHPNAELYRRLAAAFQSGDIDSVKGALAPACGGTKPATPRSWDVRRSSNR
jgi:hypothetical protein